MAVDDENPGDLAQAAAWAPVYGVQSLTSTLRSLVAIGNFDGVHRGHQVVLRAAAERARERGLAAYVLSFDPHPAEVLAGVQVERLSSVERKANLMSQVSPQLRLIVEPFTQTLADNSPEQFVRDFLVARLRVAHVIVGENFRFGKGRAGDLATLRALGQQYGFEAEAESLLGSDAASHNASAPISSSRVRRAIKAGDLQEATELLGRPHALTGSVVTGAQRGRTIGFPTANLGDVVEVLPPYGVYACLVDDLSDGEPGCALGTAVTNIGVRPTLAEPDPAPTVEAHLLDLAPGRREQRHSAAGRREPQQRAPGHLDQAGNTPGFSADLYGRPLRLHLIERLRGEHKFAGLDQLKAQIALDVAQARRCLQRQQSLSVIWPRSWLDAYALAD